MPPSKRFLSASNKALECGLKVIKTEAEGLSLVATRDFAAGEIVLTEQPLLVWENNSVYSFLNAFFKSPEEVQETVWGMDDHNDKTLLKDGESIDMQGFAQDASLRLKNEEGISVDSDQILRLLHIKHINAHSFRDTQGALFVCASVANHSCRPNVLYSSFSSGSGDDGMRFIALRTISAGMEIHPSYLKTVTCVPMNQRLAQLRNSKDFVCRCLRCNDVGFDDCRGLSCTDCLGVVVQFNTSMTQSLEKWTCLKCNKTLTPNEIKLRLQNETEGTKLSTELHKKFIDAQEALHPSDFLNVTNLLSSRFGVAEQHHLVISTWHDYGHWCLGQAEALAEMGMGVEQQVMAPWGKVCSQISFLQDAVDCLMKVICAKECITNACSHSKCSITSHSILCVDACPEVFLAVKSCIKMEKSCNAAFLNNVKNVASKYFPIMKAQFGDEHPDVKSVGTFLLKRRGVIGCHNPTCAEEMKDDAVRESPVLKACSRCGNANYCSRTCQVAHYKVHKKNCKEKVKT